MAPRWEKAKKEADELTSSISLPPVPVAEIAVENGLEIVLADFAEFSDAVAGFCDFRNRKIYVNQTDTPARRAFTMAHELGHWVLHKERYEADPATYPVLPRMQRTNKESPDPLEQEANTFAANLLVPDHLLAPVKRASVVELADAFGVSIMMMEFRLKNAR